MAKFNLKDLKSRKDVIKAKKDRSKKQSSKILPASKRKKGKRGCGCGGRRKKNA